MKKRAKTKLVKPGRAQKCGACGRKGHNVRTCQGFSKTRSR